MALTNLWLTFRLGRDWASQAYAKGLSKIEVVPMLIGAALVTLGFIRF